jgi:hypothetical protein
MITRTNGLPGKVLVPLASIAVLFICELAFNKINIFGTKFIVT